MDDGTGLPPHELTPLHAAAELMAVRVEDELLTVDPDREELRRSWLRYVWVADGLPTADAVGDRRDPVLVLDLAGRDVGAAAVDLATGVVVAGPVRRQVADAGQVLTAVVDAGRALGCPDGHWAVLTPFPVDAATGAGPDRGAGVFSQLDPSDLMTVLATRLGAASTTFLDVGAAFGLGEHVAGAAATHDRAVCVVLGDDVRAAWIDHGVPRTTGDDVPPDGRVDRLEVDGTALQDVVSRVALERAYTTRTGARVDVTSIVARADAGDADAKKVLRNAYRALGRALRPWLQAFGVRELVVGGAAVEHGDRVQKPLAAAARVRVVRARRPADAELVGAAWWVVEQALPAPGADG